MKKAVILTQPLFVNYGGIIQNFALQQALLKLNIQSVTANRLGNLPSLPRKVLSWIKNETYNRIKGCHYKKYTKKEKDLFSINAQSFIQKNINVSPDIHSTNQLEKFIKGKYDYVVIGSDQTWRPSISADIYNFFLDFLQDESQIKKIAYATSFGTDQWEFSEEQEKRCKQLVKQFDAVSVREESGISLCQQFLDVDAEHVLDPTLLLKQEDYLKIVHASDFENKEGIFTYVLDKAKQKNDLIKHVSDTLGMKVYTNQPKKDFYTESAEDLEDFVYPSIEGWLASFYKADFVITDSFHGTVFSILFNKPFITIVNHERGASRFYSLLKKLNLEDRLIRDVSLFNDEILQQPIDYSAVNSTLEKLRKDSYAFLKQTLC